MRTIEFRGKRIDNKEWIYGSLFVRKIGETWIFTDNDLSCFDGECSMWCDVSSEVIPETVGQFTGLIDKNGVKIYEGDILEVITFGFNSESFMTTIVWGDGGFKLENGRSLFYFGQNDLTKLDDALVIGNIHDNKDLL